MALNEYRRKRDFRKTTEPAGTPLTSDRESLAFVVQQHAARRLHYDFRLELDGVMKSWAMPKGPSLDPAEKRLAVQVEDHPLEYAGFEGIIPEGQYGGGTVLLWDRGFWSPADPHPAAAYNKGMLKFALHGEKLRGNWMLVRLKRKPRDTHDNWLLVKERDEGARPGSGAAVVDDHPLSVESGRTLEEIAAAPERVWQSSAGNTEADPLPRARARAPKIPLATLPGARKGPLPEQLKPQLASAATKAPAGNQGLHEIKYDGYRIIARIDRGKVRLITRNGLDWTSKFPELTRRFSELQDAIASGRTGQLTFYAFDLLHEDGWDLAAASLEDRKALLADIIPPDTVGALRYSDHQEGHGPTFFDQAQRFGLEGIVSKRRDGPYRPGRNRGWLKIKARNVDEFVVVGFTDPGGRRAGLGALLLGYYDPQGRLRYAGRVGSGFSATQLMELRRQLDELRSARLAIALPVHDAPYEARFIHWTRPLLVVEVEYAGWSADAILRHAVFRGLREDKSPQEIVYDPASLAAAHTAAMPPEQATQPAPLETARPARDGSVVFGGMRLTHPDRILWPAEGSTKFDLARYYATVADRALPHLAHRPLTLLRTPGGRGGKSFYQKHVAAGMPDVIRRVVIAGEGSEPHPVIEDLAGLIALVQFGVIEIHPWGATVDRIETPDRVTFDLDPDEGLPWSRVTEAATTVRDALRGIGLESFAKTTGGKGLHVVVPLAPKLGWVAVKAFCRWVAERLADQRPSQFTANQTKPARRDRIYVDYLRNSQGATAIGAYSPRARPGALVSTPLFWDEVADGVLPTDFTIVTVPQRIAALSSDPWAEIGRLGQSIDTKVRRQVGI